MKRIYADFNDFAADGTLLLTCKGSVDSIAALAVELRSGEEVVLSDDEMEVIARVFRLDDGCWEARSDWRFVDVGPSRSGAQLRWHRALDVESIRSQAEQAGFTTFVLPATGIVDRASFFDAVRLTLPLDPPLEGSRSWDALSDSLWGGLYTHEARRIAILWPGSGDMARSASSDFETALNVLADVASSLAHPRATGGAVKEVVVLVDSLR